MSDQCSILFNVDEAKGMNYKEFIESLKPKLTHFYSDITPVLRPQSEPPSWLDIRLTSGDSTITVRIDKTNLYLVVGYSRDDGATFWEFADSSLIPGSRKLTYSGSYVGGHSLTEAAGIHRKGLWLGLHSLGIAIATLARTENPNSKRCARALLVLNQMISEPTRFQEITDYIFTNWYNTVLLPEGVLANLQQTYVNVRTLVSIEYVRLNEIARANPAQLYGTVKVKDASRFHTVYDRSSSDYEYRGSGGFATLTGPSTAISGDDMFTISVELRDYGCLPPDDEIANGDIVWEPGNENLTSANHLEKVVVGNKGSVTVGYSVIRQALNSTINVTLINRDNRPRAQVYGTIKASQGLGGSSTSLTLFRKSCSEYVPVNPLQSIPLTRSVVVAPVNNGLKIFADLWDYDISSPDGQIVQGSAHFDAMVGTKRKSIHGRYGEVQVSVTCE